MPRASRCSAGPTVAPKMFATSASLSAASCPIVSMPSRCNLLFGDRSDPPQPPDGQPVEQSFFLGTADDPNPVGFGQPGRDFGDLLARPRTYRSNQASLVAYPLPQLFAESVDILGRRPSELGGFPEGLIERQLLHHGDQAAHGVEHAAAGHAVHHTAGRQHHRRNTDLSARLMHRHRRPRTEDPGLIAGSGHDSAAAQAANQHRTPPQGRPGELLDGREERIHIQVQHPSGLHGCRCYWAVSDRRGNRTSTCHVCG